METQIYHTLGLAKIQRTRLFPGKGDVLVRVGQKVDASDAIAEFFPEEKFLIVNIRKELNYKNSDDARRSINVKIGDKIKKGDLLAKTSGALSKSVKAQNDAEVINIIGSQVVLRLNQTPKSLIAGFESIVTEILPYRGVVIETNGALIQGVWGNQKATSGPIVSNMTEMFEELTSQKIDVSFRGSIILGGFCADSDVFKVAEDLNIKGLILASMSASIANAALNCSIPIILLEGFGPIPLNERAFELIKSNENNIISLNAIYDVKKFEKPEIIIQLSVEGTEPVDGQELRNGCVVRVNSGPDRGKAAIVKKTDSIKTKLTNGIRTTCATIEFSDGDQVSVPLANLDILE